MHRLRRLIALLIVSVLVLQTGAMAAHAHVLMTPAPLLTAADSPGMHTDHQPVHDTQHVVGDHCAQYLPGQMCSPTGFTASMLTLAIPMSPVAPVPAVTAALPSPRADSLLRPPRHL